jgi:hypothetical protein
LEPFDDFDDSPDEFIEEPDYKYVREGIKEFIVVGSASAEHWENILYPQDLSPKRNRDRVPIRLSHTLSSWMSKWYFELRVYVELSMSHHQHNEEGLYLVWVMNTSPFISFIERTFYNMPHRSGQVAMQLEKPPVAQVKVEDQYLWQGKISSREDKLRDHEIYTEKQLWQGPVFLPDKKRGLKTDRRFFEASFEGQTKILPFSEQVDSFTLSDSLNHPLGHHLNESGFRIEQWHLRHAATHKRTRVQNVASSSYY